MLTDKNKFVRVSRNEKISNPSNFYHLIDIGTIKEPAIPLFNTKYKVVVHSGHQDSVKFIRKIVSSLNFMSTFNMPSWELEEVLCLSGKMGIDSNIIKSNFLLCGGNPKYIFCDEHKLKRFLNENILQSSENDIAMACRGLLGNIFPTLSFSLLAISVTDDFKSPIVDFASRHVETQIMVHYRDICMNGLRVMIEQSVNFQDFRPKLYESTTHLKLASQVELKLYSLSSSSTIDVSFQETTVKFYHKLNEINALEENMYYRPISVSNESYDSFRYMNDEVYLFQITVAKSHDIKLEGVKAFKKQFFKDSKNQIINLVFVMPRQDLLYDKEQPLVTKKDGSAAVSVSLKQYCCLLPV